MVESEDEQALDLLGKTTAIRVELVRTLTVGSAATAETPERKGDSSFTLPLSRAYFWDDRNEPGSGPKRRVLWGEIDLENKLMPTFVFPRLSIEVGYVPLYYRVLQPRSSCIFVQHTVDFRGFEATGWVAKHEGHTGPLLLSEPVRVTSRQLAGVRMKSNAPPRYKRPEVNYIPARRYLGNPSPLPFLR